MVDPHDPDPALSEHRAACHDCNLFTQRLLQFESRLERALGVPVAGPKAAPPSEADAPPNRVVPLRRKSPTAAPALPYRKGWLTMAASFLLALVVAGGLWLSAPGSSLAA
ncbi:MAG: hypothetical protein WBF89_10675, partial [Steroidobacteraceae bacterium]